MPTRFTARPSALAGQWYPANPGDLAAVVDHWLAVASPRSPARTVVALVSPHAGYQYSGAVAGRAFALVRGLAPETVAVVGPMHDRAPAPVLTSGHSAYLTPLGQVPIDVEALHTLDQTLQADLGVPARVVRNDLEHSIEIELPFLQRALAPGFRLLPVMIHEQSREVTRALGRALAHAVGGRRAILVASTDLSHGYPDAVARRLDAELLRRVEAFDPESVFDADEEGTGFACGLGALAGVLLAARALGGDRAEVVHHATSADVTGDDRSVVGYGAAVVTRPERACRGR